MCIDNKKTGDKELEFTLEKQFPFQKTKEVPNRKEIYEKVKHLFINFSSRNPAEQNNYLVATIHCKEKKPSSDLENILIYNFIGESTTSFFDNLTSKGLCLLINTDESFNKYTYTYQIEQKFPDNVAEGTEIVRYDAVEPAIEICHNKKARDYFKEVNIIKSKIKQPIGKVEKNDRLGIHLQITGSNVHIASVMKPLLDGILSSFHKMAEHELKKKFNNHSSPLNENEKRFYNILKEANQKNETFIFGEDVNYVVVGSKNIRLSPSDHLFDQIRIDVVHESEKAYLQSFSIYRMA